MDIGPSELLIILVIVILLFGVGRVSKLGGELGSAVANFRRGLQEGGKGLLDSDEKKSEDVKVAEAKSESVS
jgi:sec-independent protein translocase protein TatA